MKGKTSIAIGALFALAVTCDPVWCGRSPSIDRRAAGAWTSRMDEPIVVGVHWELLCVQHIVQYSGSIHREQMACTRR